MAKDKFKVTYLLSVSWHVLAKSSNIPCIELQYCVMYVNPTTLLYLTMNDFIRLNPDYKLIQAHTF